MNCESAMNALDALADGELRGVSAWRTQRHLAKCANCRQALDETRRIAKAARAWRTAEASSEWRETMKKSFSLCGGGANAALADEEQADARPSALMLQRENRRELRRVSWAVAVLAVSGGAAVLLRPPSAYAQIQRAAHAMTKLKSAHVVYWHLMGYGDRKVTLEAWYSQPNRTWMKDGDRLTVSDGEKVWRYREGSAFVVQQPITDQERFVNWWEKFNPENQVRDMGGDPSRLQDLGVQEIGGESLHALRLLGPTRDERETWWVDPKTNLVRRFSQEQHRGSSWVTKAESVKIEYDAEPPADVFAFSPQPGTKVFTLQPGSPGSFSNRICDGRVLATRKDLSKDHFSDYGTGTLSLNAFTRSESGLLFAAVNGDMLDGSPDDAVKFELTDSRGGTYAEKELGSDRRFGYVRVFFSVRPPANPDGLTYRLRYYRIPAGGGRDPYGEDADRYRLAAEFDDLKPTTPPPGLDDMLEEFLEDEYGGISIDYARSVKLGLLAYRQKRYADALKPLETAISLVKSGFEDDALPAFLALADLYADQGRKSDAIGLLERLRRVTAGRDRDVLLRSAELLRRLGGTDTESGLKDRSRG
jgi:outer membrane lipoprotein-sorting protein